MASMTYRPKASIYLKHGQFFTYGTCNVALPCISFPPLLLKKQQLQTPTSQLPLTLSPSFTAASSALLSTATHRHSFISRLSWISRAEKSDTLGLNTFLLCWFFARSKMIRKEKRQNHTAYYCFLVHSNLWGQWLFLGWWVWYLWRRRMTRSLGYTWCSCNKLYSCERGCVRVEPPPVHFWSLCEDSDSKSGGSRLFHKKNLSGDASTHLHTHIYKLLLIWQCSHR